MKTWTIIILSLALSMCAACAPQKGSEKPHPEVAEEEPVAPETGGGNSANGKKNGGGKKCETLANDCGAPVIQKCNLFGLSPVELLEIRRQLPQNVNSQLKERGFDENQIEQIRAARLVQWILEKYPESKVTSKFISSDDFFKFYNSIIW